MRFYRQSYSKKLPKNRYAEYLPFKGSNDKIIDEGIAIYFQKPHSYTGEDVLEFQCHGGSVVLDLLLNEILKSGLARQAQAGEFTERAFLNGKIDLTQAEAIADLINATSEKAAISAINSLQGAFSNKIKELNEKLIKLRTYVEATIDFPDESIDFIDDGQVLIGLNELTKELEAIRKTANQGVLLQEGLRIVIAGQPNAGKSSLLNLLSGKESAIVTDIAGTTRDVLKEQINIDGMPLHIIDTAGLRNHTNDIVEKIGIDRAWKEIETANRILFVFDSTQKDYEEQINLFNLIKDKTNNKIAFSIIYNKLDLVTDFVPPKEFTDIASIKISAKDANSLDVIKEHLKQCAGYDNSTEGVFSARRRHIVSLQKAEDHIQTAIELIQNQSMFELSAEELRSTQQCLNEILGEYTADDLLGNIFNTFCVGK